MKLFLFAVMLSLIPMASSFPQGQDEKDKERRQPAPQQEPKRPEQPEKERERQPERDKPPQDRERQDREKQDRDKQDRDKQEKDRQDRNRQDRNRVQQGQPETRDRQSRRQPDHEGRRIPDDRFRASFGREHRFQVHPQRRGEVQGGEGPRFQYAGYWFEIVEPWPAAWSYDDDCYIDYIDDDYYLFDAMRPGVRLLIIVVE